MKKPVNCSTSRGGGVTRRGTVAATLMLGMAVAGAAFAAAWVQPSRAPVRPIPVAARTIVMPNAGLADSVARLLPDGPVMVEILAPEFSPRMQELSGKLRVAAARDPRWFQKYAREQPRPMPWHVKLGLTRVEYDEYVRGGRSATLAVRARAQLTFERTRGARRWTLHGQGPLANMEGTVIDLDANQVSTHLGVLPGQGIAQPNEPGAALDWRWFAVWKATHQSGDPMNGGETTQASLHLGPLAHGRSAAIYWTGRRVSMGRSLGDEFLLLRFAARR